MLNIRNERRHRKVVELICEKLKIDNKELDAYIEKGKIVPLVPKKATVKKK